MIVNLKVHAPTTIDGSQGNGCDNRQAVMSVPAILDGRLASGRPGATHHRLEHKAAFIEHHDTPAVAAGFFLSVAILPYASA